MSICHCNKNNWSDTQLRAAADCSGRAACAETPAKHVGLFLWDTAAVFKGCPLRRWRDHHRWCVQGLQQIWPLSAAAWFWGCDIPLQNYRDHHPHSFCPRWMYTTVYVNIQGGLLHAGTSKLTPAWVNELMYVFIHWEQLLDRKKRTKNTFKRELFKGRSQSWTPCYDGLHLYF